jgi:hypothetical protein
MSQNRLKTVTQLYAPAAKRSAAASWSRRHGPEDVIPDLAGLGQGIASLDKSLAVAITRPRVAP